MRRAVVLGNGFGGLAAVWWLRRLMARGNLHIAAVDHLPTMTFRPGLVQALTRPSLQTIAACRVDPAPLFQRLAVHGVRDTVVGVDPARRQVHLAVGRPLAYDALFITVGHRQAWELVEGLEPGQGVLCEDFLAFHLASRLSKDDWPPARYVLAIGPLAGGAAWSPPQPGAVEWPVLEAALLLDHQLRRRGHRHRSRLTIVCPAAAIAEEAGPDAQEYLQHLLHARGIEVVTGATHLRLDPGRLSLADRPAIPFDRIFWVPPLAGFPWLRDAGLGDANGFVPTTNRLAHREWPGIYAIGDIVGQPWPRMAHAAMVEARVAVHHWVGTLTAGGSRAAAYRPATVAALELGGGRGLFVWDDRHWGGSRHTMAVGRWPSWAKAAAQRLYVARRGALPVMP